MERLHFSIFCMLFLLIVTACDSRHSDVTEEISGETPTGSTSGVAFPDAQRRMVSEVRQQSKLYTTEYQIHKIVLYSDESRIGGKLVDIPLPGTRKIAVPIDVTLKAYVDFADFSAGNVLVADSLCIVTLPDPKVVVTASRVDYGKARQYVSMARSKFSEAEVSRLTAQGEDSIVKHIAGYGIIEQSRRDCARILVPIVARMGFEAQNIVVRFRKDYSDDDLYRLTQFDRIERGKLK